VIMRNPEVIVDLGDIEEEVQGLDGSDDED